MNERTPPTVPGFSLIELLAVLGIIGILFALVVPSVTSMMEGSNLTQAGQTLADQVNLARQIASAKNQTVEIRLIKRPATAPGYNAVQLWSTPGTSAPKPLGKIADFPQGMVISENKTKLSIALDKVTTSTMPDPSDSSASLIYAAFQIRPSGIVTPTLDMKNLFFTVLSAKNADATDFPNNYLMVQINPLTGNALTYRP